MEYKKNLRNGGWHGVMAFVRAALSLLTSLLALRILGASNYGHLVTWMSLFIIYLSLNSNAFTVLVVKLIHSNQKTHQHKYTLAINSAVAFGIISVLLLGLIISIFLYYFPFGQFDVEQLPDRFMGVIFILGILTSVQIFVSLQASVIEGGGRLDLAAKAQLLGPLFVSMYLSIKYLFHFPMEILEYLYTLCFGAVVDVIVLSLVRRKLRLPIFMALPNLASLLGLLQMLRAGGVLQAASLLNLFFEPVNKFLLISYAGAPLVAAYDLAMKVLLGVQHLFASAMRVFLHIGNQDRCEIGRVYVRVLILFVGPVVLTHIVGLFFVFAVANYWAPMDIYSLVIFFSIAAISNLGMICITPLYLGLIARNDLLVVFNMHALLALVNVSFSYLLIPRFGLVGSAIGLLFATVVNFFYIFTKCGVERIALKDGFEPLLQLAKRVGVLFFILFSSAIWCVVGEGDLLALCVLLFMTLYALNNEPLTGRLVNYFFPKNIT